LYPNPSEGAEPIAIGLRAVIKAYTDKIDLNEDPGLKTRVEQYLHSPAKKQQDNIVIRFFGWIKAKLLSFWSKIKSLFSFTSNTSKDSSEAKKTKAAPTRVAQRHSTVKDPILSEMGNVLREVDSRKGLGLADPRTGTFDHGELMEGLDEIMREGEVAPGKRRPG
jgi:hypothetical protein